ncbi:MAG: anaerobic glycerol-3-phosphate dehydrogenase subunit C [Chloroflexi bacterium]|nr:anaerobic glycerol-3-phosphate dehydrogenase subunit C [Chloroflexota bacterium]
MPANNKLAIDTKEFWDEEALLKEERRQLDVCHGCRLCWNFCPAFPTLFDITDGVDGAMDKLSRQDLRPVEVQCYQCKLCYIRCPYTEPHHYDLDVPRLFLRANLVNKKKSGVSWQDRILGDTDLLGKVGGLTAPMANMGNNVKPLRFVMEKVMGVHRDASLPKFHSQNFAAWFKKHEADLNAKVSADARKVALFYTCTVNYNDPPVGQACVEVLTHNNVRVIAPKQQCCGMPFLDGGALDSAMNKVRANLATLSETVRDGYDIVVPGPTCSYMLKQEYPQLAPGEDSKLVSEHTFDVSEYLWKLKEGGSLKTEFPITIGKVAYHAPCHLRAQFVGTKGVGLMQLIPGTEVEQVDRCSHHDGTWGVKKNSHLVSLKYGKRLFEDMQDAEADIFVTDCPLASMQIEHATERRPVHPMQVLKTAYGI